MENKMVPLNITHLDDDTLIEYAEWWGKNLEESVDRLLYSSVADFKINLASVIGIITLYDVYLDEIIRNRNYTVLKIKSLLLTRETAIEKIAQLEDWVYGTERLREPVRAKDIIKRKKR